MVLGRLDSLVTVPKAVLVDVRFGALKVTWLKVFRNCVWKRSVNRSASFHCFATDRSQLLMPSERRAPKRDEMPFRWNANALAGSLLRLTSLLI